ncbi:unnamed protein product, partial [Choristocarpus tenellus]
LIDGFRVVSENGTIEPFAPYEEGFVGKYGDPFTTFTSDRINEGAPSTASYPRQYEGVNARQICPGMVGPLGDGRYYCMSKDHGYCDRRSGTCFCNKGYQGISCADCTNTHFMEGNLCYPRLLCPNDCSGAGICHPINGTCSCFSHRVGEDCSSLLCSSLFGSLCKSCTENVCQSCENGYYVSDSEGEGQGRCLPCHKHDPRCTRCNEQGCLECGDPLLLSIRRSGARIADPPLPFDEWNRELPHNLEFGTQDPTYFVSAEVFSVVANASSPLNETSVACHQGLSRDDTWECESDPHSHLVCGHEGILSFNSPSYRAFEGSPGKGNGTVRISVSRTGGGYGRVEVTYRLRHVTTNDSDVTAFAPYTSSTTLVFESGTTEMSFLLSIHQDGIPESDETFNLLLENPRGGARLGAQRKTSVEIIDGDRNGSTDPSLTWAIGHITNITGEHALGTKKVEGVAGETGNLTLVSMDSEGQPRGEGGDIYTAWVEDVYDDEVSTITILFEIAAYNGNTQVLSKDELFIEPMNGVTPPAAVITSAWVKDEGNGNYTIRRKVNAAGEFLLHVELCVAGGLMGSYFSNVFWLERDFWRVDRQDSTVNFTWSDGPVAGTATDYVGVRWAGYIRPDFTEAFLLSVETLGDGDTARLWMDGILLVDVDSSTSPGSGNGYAEVNMTTGWMHEVVLEYREYTEEAAVALVWSSPSVQMETIPAENLYWVREISGSPFSLSIRSAPTDGELSEAFGSGLVTAVAALPTSFIITPRDSFGNSRSDELDPDVTRADLFEAVLEVVEEGGDGMSRGPRTVTATLDLQNLNLLGSEEQWRGSGSMPRQQIGEGNTFRMEYTPYIAGVHRLNVTYQVHKSILNEK